MDSLSQLKNNIRFKNLNPPKIVKKNSNTIKIILIVLLLLALVYLYRDKIFDFELRLPHSKNEDELSFLPKSSNDVVIGVEPSSDQSLYNVLDDSQKNFYTISEVIKPEYYFRDNKDIKIKDFKENCKVYNQIDKEPIYYDCLSDNYVYDIKSNDKYIVNEYFNDKIINGSEFLIGDDIVKGYENSGLMATL